MSAPYESPEVRAAWAGRAPRPAGAEIIPVHAPVGPALERLLASMIEADEVYIVGVLPWECSRRLIELRQQRIAHGPPPPPKTVHYFIPKRDEKSTGAVMAPRIQRWVAGLFGVRNWVVPYREEGANRDTLIIHHYRDDPGSRVILTRKGDHFRASTVVNLPLTSLPSEGTLIVADFGELQTGEIRKRVLDDLLPNSLPGEIRQVRCFGPRYEDTGDPNSFTPRLMRLTDRRRLNPGETEPAVVVAICGRTARGPVVVLKRRHRSNAFDDFDRLSLISEHVIADDLVDWIKRLPRPLDPDDGRAVEQLWAAAGRPKQIVLPQQFFAEAAQRELFLSCGLNVDFNRLDFRGYRLVGREEDDTHLGFAVYRLDLIQNDDLDELEIVRQWSTDMVPVPLDRLYDHPEQLNRLLRLQRGWLVQNVLPHAPRVPGPRTEGAP
jgi:hypothetical protein